MEVNNTKDRQKLIIITILIIVCMILTYIFKIKLDIGRVYTHFFYIPIILACYWWNKKGLIVVFILSIYLIFFHIFFKMEEILVFDFFRAIMFIVIGIFTSYLSTLLNKSKIEIAKSHEKLKHSYSSLKESERKLQQQSSELKKSKNELQQRVDELEKFHNLVVGRELKMVELKNIIKHLTGKKVK